MLSFLTLATISPSLRADGGPGLAAFAFPSSCSFLGGPAAEGVFGARWLFEVDASGLDLTTRLALEGVPLVDFCDVDAAPLRNGVSEPAVAAAARAADDAVGRVSLSSRADEEGVIGVAAARAGVVVEAVPGVFFAGEAADGVADDILAFAFVGVAAPLTRAFETDPEADGGTVRVRAGEALPGSGGMGDFDVPDAFNLVRDDPADDKAESGRPRLAMLDFARAGVTGAAVLRDGVELEVGADGEDGERTCVVGDDDVEADGGGDVMLARAFASEDAVGVIARVETDWRSEAESADADAVGVDTDTGG